jgi:lipopolysaccharide heptosyltransferase II
MQQKNYSKILVINPYGIGDVLFATPLLSNLKASFPQGKIGIVLGSRTKQILESNTDVDNIYIFDKGHFDKLSFFKKWQYLIEFCNLIKKEKYELLIDLSNSSQYGFVSKFFLKIPQRIGFNYRGRGQHLTDKISLDGFCDKHVADYYLSLLNLIGICPVKKDLKFPLKQDVIDKVAVYLAGKGVEKGNFLIVLVPAGGRSWSEKAVYKQWPQDKYAQLADRLISELKARIIIAGAEADKEICYNVLNLMQLKKAEVIINFSILEFAALCNLSDLVICNDGGPLHVAISQKTPTISFFGPVDEKVYGPYSSQEIHAVITNEINCRPCYQKFRFNECGRKDCLNLISVDEAFKKAKEILKVS